MTVGKLLPPSQALDLSATKNRTQGLERREGLDLGNKLVEVNASHGARVTTGNSIASSAWYATEPVQFYEVIMSSYDLNDDEVIQIRKNATTIRSLTFAWQSGAYLMQRFPCAFALDRDDFVDIYAELNYHVERFQVQMRGVSKRGGYGTLTFKSTCFVPATPVLTPAGFVPIGDLGVGAEILSADGVVGVVEEMKWRSAQTLDLVFGDEAVTTTREHPFSVAGRWVKAGNLDVGSLVDHVDGSPVAVTGATLNISQPVVNLHTSTGTFHVGSGFLVHNK